MADPVSIASAVARLITLSGAVLAAGCKYVNDILSAPQELRSLIQETAALNAVLAELISPFLGEKIGQHIEAHVLVHKEMLQDCEGTLRSIESLIHDCDLISGRRGTIGVSPLLRPLKKREIIKNQEQLSRICTSLHPIVSVHSASTLRLSEYDQRHGNEAIEQLARNADRNQEQKILEWLSLLDQNATHTTTTLLRNQARACGF